MARLSKRHLEVLAEVRYALRRFLRFGEDAARKAGLTPQQHQLLLAVKGFPGRDWATVGEVAERLQLRHHSAVGLVDRAEQLGLITRRQSPDDRRMVRIGLTQAGEKVLARLTPLHLVEMKLLGPKLALVARLPQAAARPAGARRKPALGSTLKAASGARRNGRVAR
jgi:DNA-binding MarR family transcriptional regulator